MTDTAFDFYAKRLATVSADGYLRIWNKENEAWVMQTEIKAHSTLITRVDWMHPLYGQVVAICQHNRGAAIYEESLEQNQKKTWVKRADLFISQLPMDIAFCPHYFGLRLVGSDGDVVV